MDEIFTDRVNWAFWFWVDMWRQLLSKGRETDG